MFWSKIWFFLVAAAAVVGIGVALTVPRPAERKVLETEDTRLEQAMESVRLYLMLEARGHVDTALHYARHEIYVELKKIKDDATSAEAIAQQLHDSARSTLDAILAKTRRAKPQLLIAVDAWGRVVARAGLDEKEWGDDLSGYFLVRDALRGYMRDDLWLTAGKLYRVAAAPVVAQPEEGPDSYVGAVVVGYELDEKVARNLARIASSRACGGEGPDSAALCDTHVAFFARGETISNSGPTTMASSIKQELGRHDAELSPERDVVFDAGGEATTYRVVAKRLPGEVGAQDGVYVVYSERPRSMSFAGALKSITKDDLGFATFPWMLLGFGFAAALAVGLLLMWVESDRPLKRLVRESLALGKGDAKAFSEEVHGGKHGSIARSVNLALEKLGRDKTARRDLGALYATDDTGPQDAVRPLPPAGPLGAQPTPWSPPPPSDFAIEPPQVSHAPASFDYAPEPAPPPFAPLPPPRQVPRPAPMPSMAAIASNLPLPELPRPMPRPAPTPPALAAARVAPVGRPVSLPLTAPLPPPLPPPPMPSPLSALDDDILGGHDPDNPGLTPPPPAGLGLAGESATNLVRELTTTEGETAYYRQVYQDFIELKRKCGESTDSLTYEKFLVKLTQNRDQLIAKYACKAVKFQVYVKDGKAALKATPVRG